MKEKLFKLIIYLDYHGTSYKSGSYKNNLNEKQIEKIKKERGKQKERERVRMKKKEIEGDKDREKS